MTIASTFMSVDLMGLERSGLMSLPAQDADHLSRSQGVGYVQNCVVVGKLDKKKKMCGSSTTRPSRLFFPLRSFAPLATARAFLLAS